VGVAIEKEVGFRLGVDPSADDDGDDEAVDTKHTGHDDGHDGLHDELGAHHSHGRHADPALGRPVRRSHAYKEQTRPRQALPIASTSIITTTWIYPKKLLNFLPRPIFLESDQSVKVRRSKQLEASAKHGSERPLPTLMDRRMCTARAPIRNLGRASIEEVANEWEDEEVVT
jgi:hypothetical protein